MAENQQKVGYDKDSPVAPPLLNILVFQQIGSFGLSQCHFKHNLCMIYTVMFKGHRHGEPTSFQEQVVAVFHDGSVASNVMSNII